jgi:hypothetical protein
MRNRLMENLFPTIIGRQFWLHRHMRGNTDTRKVLMWLEGRYLRLGLETSPAKETNTNVKQVRVATSM